MPDYLEGDHSKNEYSIRISNIPPGITKEAVKALFNEGIEAKLIKVTHYHGGAFFTYGRYGDAEKAITMYNNTPPLNLTVEFVDKNLKNLDQELKVDLSQRVVDHRYKPDTLEFTQGPIKSMQAGQPRCTPDFRQNSYSADDNYLYPVPHDESIFNPYDAPGSNYANNLMYTRGVAYSTRDGRRHVAYGRGYTFYNIPEPHYNVGDYLQSVCEKRESGVYEIATDDIEDKSGYCNVCKAPTDQQCAKCKFAFYCSRTCQSDDWQKHKSECQPMPPLIKKVSMPISANHDNLRSSGATTQPRCTEQPIRGPLRRPRTVLSMEQTAAIREQQPSSATSAQAKGDSKHTSNISNGQNKNNLAEDLKQQSNNFKVDANTFQKPGMLHKILSEDHINFQKIPCFIPEDEYIDVTITNIVGNDEYHVQKKSDIDAIGDFFVEVKNYVETQKKVAPEINKRCFVDNDDMWFRVQICQKNANGNFLVFLEDFGASEEMKINEVVPIGPYEKHPPPFAHKIRLHESLKDSIKSLKTDEIISVKALSVEATGTIVVDVQIPPKQVSTPAKECNSEKQPMQASTPTQNGQASNNDAVLSQIEKLPTLLDQLKCGDEGLIFFAQLLAEREYSVSITPADSSEFMELIENFSEDCEKQLQQNPNPSVKLGDFVGGQSPEGDWYRGVVISTNPIKLALVDESKVLSPVKLAPITEKYRNYVCYGAVCTFSAGFSLTNEPLETGTFVVTKIMSDSIEIKISSDKPVLQNEVAVAKKWLPKPEQKGINYAKIMNGHKVIITDLCDQTLMYVQSLEPKEKERFERLKQDVAKYALNGKPLVETPVVGQMVCAKYQHDSNFYRAIVIKVEGPKILVKYVDYGNDEETSMKDLFDLPDDLKQRDSCVLKIKLKDVPSDVPLNDEATNYINDLIGSEAALKCTFEGSAATDGVYLKTENNDDVNNCFKRLLQRSWEKETKVEESEQIWTLNDLPDRKLGEVGTTCQAIVLQYYKDREMVVLAPDDMIAVKAIMEDMVESIARYVEKETQTYIPRSNDRMNELCIAKYDGVFYRGLCLDTSATPTESRILFIDYGNTEIVKHSDIRRFVPDFAKFGPLGILCTIKATTKNKMNIAITEKFSQLLTINDVITIKIVSEDNEGVPNVDIPVIREQLAKENLI